MKIFTLLTTIALCFMLFLNIKQHKEIENLQAIVKGQERDYENFVMYSNELLQNLNNLSNELLQSNQSIEELWQYRLTFESLEKSGINFNGVKDIQSLLNKLEEAPYANPFGDAKISITSPFGNRDETSWNGNNDHIGIDIVPLTGNGDIYHVADGIVESFELNNPTFGHHMWVNHGNFKTHYAHLEFAYYQDRENKLIEGVTIKKGQLLGKFGSTGFTLGKHLHYEIWMKEENNWILVNPTDMVEYIGIN